MKKRKSSAVDPVTFLRKRKKAKTNKLRLWLHLRDKTKFDEGRLELGGCDLVKVTTSGQSPHRDSFYPDLDRADWLPRSASPDQYPFVVSFEPDSETIPYVQSGPARRRAIEEAVPALNFAGLRDLIWSYAHGTIVYIRYGVVVRRFAWTLKNAVVSKGPIEGPARPPYVAGGYDVYFDNTTVQCLSSMDWI